jgi:hypothetical protein
MKPVFKNIPFGGYVGKGTSRQEKGKKAVTGSVYYRSR